MPSPEEAAERAVFDDAEMSESEGSDDTESDNSDTELSSVAAAAPQNPSAAEDVEEIPPVADPVEDVPVQTIQNGDGGAMVKVEDEAAISALPAATGYESAPRLFQKLWTDEDELIILQGFYEFTSSRGTTHADYQYDTGPFYDQIKARLQLDFTKNQLIEKLRRLKKKYRTAVTRIDQGRAAVFKSPHDHATFEISRKIWSPVFKRPREINNDVENVVEASADRRSARRRRGKSEQPTAMTMIVRKHAAPIQVLPATVTPPPAPLTQISPLLGPAPSPIAQILPLPTRPAAAASSAPKSSSIMEETVQSCLSPLLKELIQSASGGGRGQLPAEAMAGGLLTPLGFGGSVPDGEKWRKQQILELEVYAKRLELVQEEIKLRLEELRSSTLAAAARENGSS